MKTIKKWQIKWKTHVGLDKLQTEAQRLIDRFTFNHRGYHIEQRTNRKTKTFLQVLFDGSGGDVKTAKVLGVIQKTHLSRYCQLFT